MVEALGSGMAVGVPTGNVRVAHCIAVGPNSAV